jgi:transcriptional regulator with XRE-family HTH domain
VKSTEKKILKNIGNEIKRLRKNQNISQQQLAFEAEVPTNQIGRIERGEINTTIITLYKISTVINLSLSNILKDELFKK